MELLNKELTMLIFDRIQKERHALTQSLHKDLSFKAGILSKEPVTVVHSVLSVFPSDVVELFFLNVPEILILLSRKELNDIIEKLILEETSEGVMGIIWFFSKYLRIDLIEDIGKMEAFKSRLFIHIMKYRESHTYRISPSEEKMIKQSDIDAKKLELAREYYLNLGASSI